MKTKIFFNPVVTVLALLMILLFIKSQLPSFTEITLIPLSGVSETLDYAYLIFMCIAISQAILLISTRATFIKWWKYFGVWYLPLYIIITLTSKRSAMGFSIGPSDADLAVSVGGVSLVAFTVGFVLFSYSVLMIKYLQKKRKK